jgi:hypothetical protein
MLSNVSWSLLVLFAVVMAFAPFGKTPHLLEKWNMLMEGTLKKPIDIFDFFLHLSPFFLMAIKYFSERQPG